MAISNNNWVVMSDRAIVAAIGRYIKEIRLALNKTQAIIAEEAGINRWTLSKLENGEPVTLLSLIQVLRALDNMNILDIFTIEKTISPIELAKSERRQRRRARNASIDNRPESDW